MLPLAALFLCGCGGIIGAIGASLDEATMCLGVDAQSRPVGATTEFDTDTPEIFCSVRIDDLQDDTKLAAEWVYVKGALAGVTDYVIETSALSAGGTRYVHFSITVPDAGWPEGDYLLLLYLDGKEKASLPFKVTASGAPASAVSPLETVTRARLTAVTLTSAVDQERRPLDSTSEFSPDAPEIHCSVQLLDAPEGTEVLAEWYYSGDGAPTTAQLLIDSASITAAQGSQYLDFSLSMPDAGWPEGDYLLLLYLDGQQETALPFSVASAAMSLREATMTTGVDSKNRPVDYTTVFPPDASGIYCSVYIANLPAGATERSEWYYLHGTGLNLSNHLYSWHEAAVVGGSGYVWFRLNPPESGLFPEGEYAFVLYVDGVELVRLPFRVSRGG